MVAYGFQWFPSLWFPMASYGFQCISMVSYGFLCISMVSYGFLPMVSHEFVWIPIGSYDFLWIPVNSYGFLTQQNQREHIEKPVSPPTAPQGVGYHYHGGGPADL